MGSRPSTHAGGGFMLRDLDAFIRYFGGVRRRTLNYIRVLPPDRVD